MGLMDKIKGLLGKNKGKVEEGIDKAADFADEKTGGKHTDKIDTAAENAKDVVEGLDTEE